MKALVVSLLCGSALVGSAQSGGPWSIRSSTLDGGGGRSTGGPWTLTGTIGQPDAASPVSAPPLSLQGGFWGSVIAMPEGPALTITPAGPLNVWLNWTAASAGYTLQYSTNLVNWTDHPTPIVGAGSLLWSLGNGTRYFFRLYKP